MVEKNIRKIIAHNIQGLRKKEKMTQIELADALFYTDKAISKWERGESLPDAEMLYKIADFFHVNINYLFVEHQYDELSCEENRKLVNRETTYKLIFIFSVSLILLTMGLSLLSSILKEPQSSPLKLLLFLIPVIPTTLFIINNVLGRTKLNTILLSIIVWTLADALYIYFLKFELVMIFGIAIVVQISIISWPKLIHYLKNTKSKS